VSIVLLSVIYHGLLIGRPLDFLVFFTNWSLLATFFTVNIGIVLSRNPQYTHTTAQNLHAIHHLLYTLSLFSAPVVFIVYWGVIHTKHLQELDRKYKHDPWLLEHKYIHTYVVHVVPPFCALIVMLITDTVLIRRHFRALIYLGIMYAYSNYRGVCIKGEPLYWFLTWEDYTSLIIAAGCIWAFATFFYVTCLIDEKVTGRTA